MKRIFAIVVATPILTLFVGVGTLALGVADKWDERNTDVLISNITMICGIGGMVLALALAAFVGLLFYARWQRDQMWHPPTIKALPTPRSQPPPWMDGPPALTDDRASKGRLYSAGPANYEDLDDSLFGDSQPISTDWSEYHE